MIYRFIRISVAGLLILLMFIGFTLGIGASKPQPALATGLNCSVSMGFVTQYVSNIPAGGYDYASFNIYNGLHALDGSFNNVPPAGSTGLPGVYYGEGFNPPGSTSYQENILVNNNSTTTMTGYVILTFC